MLNCIHNCGNQKVDQVFKFSSRLFLLLFLPITKALCSKIMSALLSYWVHLTHIKLFDTKFLCERNIIQNETPQRKTACFTVFNSCAALVTSLKSFWVLAIIVYRK